MSRAFRGLRFQLISPALPSAVRIASGFFQGGARQSWVRQPRHAHGRSRSNANGVTEVSITTPRCRQELADSTRLRVSLSWTRFFGRTCLCQRPDEVINSPATERPARIGSGTKMRIRTLPSGPSHLETSLQPRNAGRADPTLNLAPPVRANQTRPVGLVALPASIVCIESNQKIFTSNQVHRCQACGRQVKPGNGSLERCSQRSSTCLTSHSFSNAHAASFAQTWRFLRETWHANRGPARACLLVALTDPTPHGSILQHWREFHIQKSFRVLLAIRKQVLAVVAISTNARPREGLKNSRINLEVCPWMGNENLRLSMRIPR